MAAHSPLFAPTSTTTAEWGAATDASHASPFISKSIPSASR